MTTTTTTTTHETKKVQHMLCFGICATYVLTTYQPTYPPTYLQIYQPTNQFRKAAGTEVRRPSCTAEVSGVGAENYVTYLDIGEEGEGGECEEDQQRRLEPQSEQRRQHHCAL